MELHELNMHHDLEACQSLIKEQNQGSYNAFAPGSHECFLQDPVARRELRRERFRDHVSGVYQISASNMDARSVSDDESDSDLDSNSGARELCQGLVDVEDEQSSESGSDSSDYSDSDCEAIVDMRSLSSMKRPLPRRVDMLRADVRRMTD